MQGRTVSAPIKIPARKPKFDAEAHFKSPNSFFKRPLSLINDPACGFIFPMTPPPELPTSASDQPSLTICGFA